MIHAEGITLIVKLNLRLKLKSSLCDFSNEYILIKELKQLQTREQQQTQITVKK